MNPKPDCWCIKRYAVWNTYQTCVYAKYTYIHRCISDLYQTMSTLRCYSFLQNVKIRSIQIEGSSSVRWKWMHFCRSEWWVVLVWAGGQLTFMRFSMICSIDWKVPESLSGLGLWWYEESPLRESRKHLFWVLDEEIWILVGSCGLHLQSCLQEKIPANWIKQSLSGN